MFITLMFQMQDIMSKGQLGGGKIIKLREVLYH